jgi:hypothetical protein
MTRTSFEVAAAEGRVWPCPSCDGDREFVQPPCVDGHTEEGGECPEWACADCGAAFVLGEVAADVDVLRLRHAA